MMVLKPSYTSHITPKWQTRFRPHPIFSSSYKTTKLLPPATATAPVPTPVRQKAYDALHAPALPPEPEPKLWPEPVPEPEPVPKVVVVLAPSPAPSFALAFKGFLLRYQRARGVVARVRDHTRTFD